MRAKKAKPQAGAVEYRLRADPKLRKLSLRKVTERKRTPARARRATRARRDAASKEPLRGSSPATVGLRVFRAPEWHTPAVAATAVVAVAAGVLLMGRPSSDVRHVAAAEPAVTIAPASAPAETSRTRSQSPPTDAGTEFRAASASASILPAAPSPPTIANPAPRGGSDKRATDTRPLAAATAKKPVLAESPKAYAPSADERIMDTADSVLAAKPKPEGESSRESAVTITGCLENTNGAFRLKDASGAHVPKARGWRTGFMKKRPAAVELVDPANRFRLTAFLGHRVTVTGLLSDREMAVQSLERLTPSCN